MKIVTTIPVTKSEAATSLLSSIPSIGLFAAMSCAGALNLIDMMIMPKSLAEFFVLFAIVGFNAGWTLVTGGMAVASLVAFTQAVLFLLGLRKVC